MNGLIILFSSVARCLRGVPCFLDLSNVSRIDNAGLEALLAVWTAGQKKSCSVEVINLGGATPKQASLSRLGQAFRKVLALFDCQ